MSSSDAIHGTDERAAELFGALASPLRVAIMRRLGEGDQCVHDLVDAFDVTQPRVSQHLKVLRAAGLVSAERVGREMRYRLDDEHVRHLLADALRHCDEPRDTPTVHEDDDHHHQEERS